MDDAIVAELAERCDGEVVGQATLADLTTLRVGGRARVLVTAETDADLAVAGEVIAREGLPWLVVGRGSNLLIADAGWPGVAIVLGRGFRGVAVAGERIRLGAAEPLPAAAAQIAAAGRGGFAWATAVPGSVGGAVRMNAGAHGGEMSHHLVEVDLFRLRTQTREEWPASHLELRYRHSTLPQDAIVVAATLELPAADADQLRAEMAEIRRWRREHQPLNEPNCGSVFTNPPGDSAGRLIDLAGGKSLAVGNARVSERHANFIVTRPGATAADVRTLIALVQQRVREVHGVELVAEVQMRGDFEAG